MPNSPIQTLKIGNTEGAKDIANKLKINKINVKAIVSPTISKGSERLRICLHNFNTDEEIKTLTKHINQWKKEQYL
jgi:8-amino-7-oxononanoate synthase